MALFKFFGGKEPEEYEDRGDRFFNAETWGRAKVEYEHALEKLQKSAPWDDEYRQRLQEKIQQSKEALAREHKRTAANLIEAGHDEDARPYIELALELAEDAKLKSELKQLSEALEHRVAEVIQGTLAGVEIEKEVAVDDDENEEDEAETVTEEPNEDYLRALIGALPEEIQEAYLKYGDAFNHGYIALNKGEFKTADEYLTQALEENPEPDSYIPLELATVYLNLAKLDEARQLLESFLAYHPDALPAYQMLCEIYWESGAFEQANALLVSLPPELAESVAGYLLRGETLYHEGKFSEAKTFYRDFLKTFGWNETVARALAKTHEALGELANARNIYHEIMDNCRSCHTRIDPYVKQKYADLNFESDIYTTEILELYLALAKEIPHHASDYLQKVSRIYEAEGNYQEAERFKKIAEKLAPK